MQEVAYSGRVPAADRRAALPAGARVRRSPRRRARAAPAERQPRHLRRLPDRRSSSSLLAAARIGVDRMSARDRRGGRGAGRRRARCSRRCCPASIQQLEGAAAGPPRRRRRCSPTASCAGCGARAPSTSRGRRVVYRLAPPSSRRALRRRRAARPGRRPRARTGASGHDALVLVGLLALARFAVAAASWDIANGFSLMGASRDLTLVGLRRGDARARARGRGARRPARPTCAAMIAGTAGGAASGRARRSRSARVAFALVVIAETGRQPVDNPDTHLELTMIHEGPLLEYAGRDLAYLQWAAAARHWLVLVLAAAGLPAASARRRGGSSRSLPLVARRSSARALALTETLAREDADPARPAAARGRRGRRAARDRRAGSWRRRERRRSSGLLVALGLGGRRRAPALGRGRARHRAGARCSPSARSDDATTGDDVVAAAALGAPRASCSPALLPPARRAHARAAAGARRRRAARRAAAPRSRSRSR